MNALFAATRAVHYASAMVLFGELVFAFAVAGRAWSSGGGVGSIASGEFRRRFLRVATSSVAAGIVSGVAWLGLAAASMSGLPVADALDRATLALVLTATTFGNAWLVRGGLAVALCALLLALAKSRLRGAAFSCVSALLVIAAAYLGGLAWSGHAAAGEGYDGDVGIVADVVHLLAAGAWLGALPALVFLLRREARVADAAWATRRFSTLGAVCVSLLVAGGLINTWYLVGNLPALIGTSYGRLLLAKLALFAGMLVLAMANRWYLSVRLAQGERAASRLIRRNAIGEIVLGIGVVVVVGVLGITPPAVHETPVWPFTHTLALVRVEQSAWLQMALAAAGLLACVAAGVTLAGLRRRRKREWAGGLAGISVLAAIFVPLLAVPAYPSTYWSSPVRYTTDAIVNGSTIYGAHCRGCHGVDDLALDASGRAPSATAIDLSNHALRHSEGDHFWWISHGIPGTAMPGFGSRLAETDIWCLIEFLHAQVEGEEATAMTDRIKPLRGIVAPDFTFESTGQPQESLRDLRGRDAVLLVFYTLPQSLPRLRELAMDARAYRAAGARVIALPLTPPSREGDALPEDVRSVVANTNTSVATAYAMFARQSPAAAEPPSHVEFLIDGLGYLRVRWIGIAPAGAGRTAEVLDRIDILKREPLRPPPAWGHGHR